MIVILIDIPDVLVYSMELNLLEEDWSHSAVLYASSSIVYVIIAVHWIGYKRLAFGHSCSLICLLIWVARFSKRWYCPVMAIMVVTDCACLLWLLVRQSLFFKFNNQWKYGWCRIMALWMRGWVHLPFQWNFFQCRWTFWNGDVFLAMGSGNLVSCYADNQQPKDLGISGLWRSFRVVTCMSA